MATTDSRMIREVAKSMDERRIMLESFKNNIRPVRSKVRRANSSSRIGKKMITVGLVLTLGTPDPFTDLAGWPLLVAGLVADRVYSHVGVKDAYQEVNRLMRELPDLRKL
ncbi:MAG: hypothetical protein HYU39_01235 [Thaumarchaeota archaeon]|nr:hypothetical protein [Nitrososphaerota archaeon]